MRPKATKTHSPESLCQASEGIYLGISYNDIWVAWACRVHELEETKIASSEQVTKAGEVG